MYIPDDVYRNVVAYLPILCVDLLIIEHGKCLLLRRINHPAFGQFWFPGGRVRKYEKIKDAAVRICMEETGLTCCFHDIISVEESIFLKSEGAPEDKHTVNICCLMKLSSSPNAIALDMYHDAFEWTDRIHPELHEAVKHPLALAGFKLTPEGNQS